jgi:hypothetical protein
MSNKQEATFAHETAAERALRERQEAQRDAGLADIRKEVDELLASREPQPENIGDWAGHIPSGYSVSDAALEEDAGIENFDLVRQVISDGIGDLVQISGENSRDHGFHDDFPKIVEGQDKAQLALYITQKLMLMGEELFESFGEIRSGRDPLEIYFVDKKGLIGPKGAEYGSQAYGKLVDGEVSTFAGEVSAFAWDVKRHEDWIPLLKPEGFMVEIADLFIRGADLTYLLGGREHLIHALEIKHDYNSTRPFKHGRQF